MVFTYEVVLEFDSFTAVPTDEDYQSLKDYIAFNPMEGTIYFKYHKDLMKFNRFHLSQVLRPHERQLKKDEFNQLWEMIQKMMCGIESD